MVEEKDTLLSLPRQEWLGIVIYGLILSWRGQDTPSEEEKPWAGLP